MLIRNSSIEQRHAAGGKSSDSIVPGRVG